MLKLKKVIHFLFSHDEPTGLEMENSISEAATRGHAEAQYKLGKHFLKGSLGLDQNYFHAEEWLNKAKQQGHLKAARLLSNTYSQMSVQY